MSAINGDMSMGFGANRNPITPHGRVVYNAKPDMVDYKARMAAARASGMSDSDFMTIKRHEPCLMKSRTQPVRHFNHNDLVVTGCINGIDFVDSGGIAESPYTQYRFAGIAQSECLYDVANSWVSDELTVQVGGLTTVHNTGDLMIFAGDFVIWEIPGTATETLPRPRIVGQPKGKKLVGLKSLKHTIFSDLVKRVELYINPDPDPNAPDPDVDRLVSNAMHKSMLDKLKAEALKRLPAFDKLTVAPFKGMSLMAATTLVCNEMNRELKSRIIGKAMSTAEPGKQFDLLIGKYAS